MTASFRTTGRADPWSPAPYRQHPGRREHIHGRIRGIDDASPHPLAKLVIVLGLIVSTVLVIGFIR